MSVLQQGGRFRPGVGPTREGRTGESQPEPMSLHGEFPETYTPVLFAYCRAQTTSTR